MRPKPGMNGIFCNVIFGKCVIFIAVVSLFFFFFGNTIKAHVGITTPGNCSLASAAGTVPSGSGESRARARSAAPGSHAAGRAAAPRRSRGGHHQPPPTQPTGREFAAAFSTSSRAPRVSASLTEQKRIKIILLSFCFNYFKIKGPDVRSQVETPLYKD